MEWEKAARGDPDALGDFGQKFCVLRGGSWSGSRRSVRCACRFKFTPDLFGDNVDFWVYSPG